MESNSSVPIRWTNEKHVQFLNTMEASFVCSMFESKGRLARLDRFVPDTSDSTLDRIKTPKTTKKSGPVRRMAGGAVRRTRRLPSQPFISSQLDQLLVVLSAGGGEPLGLLLADGKGISDLVPTAVPPVVGTDGGEGLKAARAACMTSPHIGLQWAGLGSIRASFD